MIALIKLTFKYLLKKSIKNQTNVITRPQTSDVFSNENNFKRTRNVRKVSERKSRFKMINESDLNNVVSNILSENQYSNCRLCLKAVGDNYVRFQDSVYLEIDGGGFQNFNKLLVKLLGDEIQDIIPGIDAVCMECLDKAIKAIQFIQTCEYSTKLLHKVVNNLVETLNIDRETINVGNSLYMIINEHESKLLLVKKGIENKNIPVDRTIKCSECVDVFTDIDEFKVHNLSLHEKFTCEKCYETFIDEAELNQHENSEINYKCPECNLYKCTELSLRQHQDSCHTVYICKDCGKSFKGLNKLHNHEEKHATKSKCPKCGKSYTTKDFFTKHVKLCLKNMLDPHPMRSKLEKKYSCIECGKGYSTPGGLKVHNRFVHGNAKPHTCEICNKEFTAPSYLKVHMIKHTGVKNYKCDICNRKFVSKEALLYHTRRHTGEKPYSCHICSEKFVNASARAEHIKYKHVGPTLICEICSRKFVTPTFLRQHIKKHHDPTSKLYAGRDLIPPDIPDNHNIMVRYAE